MALKSAIQVFFLVIFLVGVLGDDETTPHDTLYDTPKPSGPVVFLETFNDDHWTRTWTPSADPKFNGDWEVQESEYVRVSGDRGLVVADKAKHHAIGALFPSPLDTTGKDLVVQYEVQLQRGLECGGAYLKLITSLPDLDITHAGADTPYTIMFGPDKCGTDDKVHFIIRHENPVSHVIEEKHLSPRPHIKTDKLTHLYTLHVRPDNTFEIFIDKESVKSGSLLKDFQPPINPPTEIDDATDKKPVDWVDEEYIPDPSATKPDDWDEDAPALIDDPLSKKPEGWLDNEAEQIPDPTAQKPEEWNDEEDGEWIPVLVDNPKCEEVGCGEWKPARIKNPLYKGKWTRPNMKNPDYKGVWAPRKIQNPHYFEDLHPSNFPKMAGVVFELWTMNDGILFDNILITHDKDVADDYADRTWAVKFAEESKKYESERPAKPDEDGFMATVQNYLLIVYKFAVENPIIMGASVIVGLVPLFICANISAPPKQNSSTPTEQAENEDEEEDEDRVVPESEEKEEEKEEEIQEEEKDTKKSPTQRKRKIPRAD